MGLPLLTDSGNGHAATNSFEFSGKPIPAIYTIAASLFPLSDDWLSAISYLQRETLENG
jgi:hypothetical protein